MGNINETERPSQKPYIIDFVDLKPDEFLTVRKLIVSGGGKSQPAAEITKLSSPAGAADSEEKIGSIIVTKEMFNEAIAWLPESIKGASEVSEIEAKKLAAINHELLRILPIVSPDPFLSPKPGI